MMKGRFVDQSRTFAPLFCWLKIDHYVFTGRYRSALTFASSDWLNTKTKIFINNKDDKYFLCGQPHHIGQ